MIKKIMPILIIAFACIIVIATYWAFYEISDKIEKSRIEKYVKKECLK